jgi:hypothetical protein
VKGRVGEEICRRDLPITVGRKPRRFWSSRLLKLMPMGSRRTATEDNDVERLYPVSTSSIRSHETLSRIAFPRCDR